MQIKKIVISPSNTKAIQFIDDLNKKKAETVKKIESLPNLFSTAKKTK